MTARVIPTFHVEVEGCSGGYSGRRVTARVIPTFYAEVCYTLAGQKLDAD
jgi:hypothetical protein